MLRRLEGGLVTSALLLAGVVGACDGTKFSGSTPADAGAGGEPTSSTAGMPSDQGGGVSSPGASGQGGSPGEMGGAAGSAGAGSCETNADCDAGRFCQLGACVSCEPIDDLDALEYGNPEPLAAINQTVELEGLRFPRPAGVGQGLVYARDFFGAQLWFTTDATESPGVVLPKPASTTYQSSGLRVDFAPPAELAAHDFFFQRSVKVGDITETTLYGAKLDRDGLLTGATALPAPFNDAAVTASYSLALSEQRAVWMQNVNGVLDIHLKTVALPVDTQEPAELLIPLPFECGFATELEYAPWLTPGGNTLFFTARVVSEACLIAPETPSAIYVVGLSNAGEPLGPARSLTGLGPEGSRQTDPALSADGCHLFYASQSDEGMLLYRAERLN